MGPATTLAAAPCPLEADHSAEPAPAAGQRRPGAPLHALEIADQRRQGRLDHLSIDRWRRLAENERTIHLVSHADTVRSPAR